MAKQIHIYLPAGVRATRTADANWDESKHKRADDGKFGSGSAKAAPDPRATTPEKREEANNNAEGREGVHEQEQRWAAKMPKGSMVKTPSGKPMKVLGHKGNMIETSEGMYHATKLQPVAK